MYRVACSVQCASLSVVHVQGACGPGGRVQVRGAVLRPVRLRRLVRQPAQEARGRELPQGLEGGGEGDVFRHTELDLFFVIIFVGFQFNNLKQQTSADFCSLAFGVKLFVLFVSGERWCRGN